MTKKTFVMLLVLLVMAPSIAACGKKPGELESPPGEQSDFPRKYPR
jgi:predicted small lipoprotein YifL